MAFAQPNPTFAAEVARLARCFDAVGPILASAAHFQWDDRQDIDGQQWAWQGGALSVTWSDERLDLWGGNIGFEQTVFGGEARILLRPTAENDSMSERRAFVVLSLRAMRDRGTMLAGEYAYLDIGDARHTYPESADEDSALITVPFRLRLRLQTVAGTGEETLTTSVEVQR